MLLTVRLIFMQLWHLKHVCCQQKDVTLKDLNLYLGISQLFLKTDGLYQMLMKKKKKETSLVSIVVVKN